MSVRGEGRGRRSRLSRPASDTRHTAPCPAPPPRPGAPTEVAVHLAQQLAPRERRHAQAAVPVAAAEQQLPVGGHGQGLPAHAAAARRPGATQKPLPPVPKRWRRRRTGEARGGTQAQTQRLASGLLRGPLSPALPSSSHLVESLMNLK